LDIDYLLNISGLSVEYRTGNITAKAVNDLNLNIKKGQAVGLVGESGAGKTTTALSILGLLPEKTGFITGGNVLYKGQSLLGKKDKEMANIRGSKISMVFANPLSSLNPVFNVGHQIAMVIRKHKHVSEKAAKKQASEMLNLVGIPEYRMDDYPHQFSGGMRQRVGIAAALACSPELLIADEPTTALDVTIQAQILELMKNLQRDFSSSLLMITHNLGIIAELCQVIAVMYAGEVVEYGLVKEVFSNPKHWYTVGLLHAMPKLAGNRERLVSIPGNVANAQSLPDGCRFHLRCGHCEDQCRIRKPPMMNIGGHYVQCWEYGDGHE
jgi:peptide/nickel transport system ATP-binding protein